MEQPPTPRGGERHPEPGGVNSYGTDDPAAQAAIERALADASAERKRDRARLEQLVADGMTPAEAEALIEFEHAHGPLPIGGGTQPHHNPAGHDSAGPWDPAEQVGDIYEVELGPQGIERAERLSLTPKIYVAPLASHVRSSQHGHWIDANQPAAELDASITAAVGSQDWTVAATEDFAGLDLHGYTDVTLIAQLGRGVAEYGVAYAVYVELVGTSDRDQLDRFGQFYVGSYDSPEAWAREVGEDLDWERHLDQVVDPMLRPCLTIDYGRFARDQRQCWDLVQGIDGKTHVFMR